MRRTWFQSLEAGHLIVPWKDELLQVQAAYHHICKIEGQATQNAALTK